MSGRILSERLLATTSLAALILAGSQHSAFAIIPCPGATNPGGDFSNGGAIACVFLSGTATSSVTNLPGGVIGPALNIVSAILVRPTATLSGAIVNAGRIVGSNGSAAIGIAVVDGLVRGGITNSGTISVGPSVGTTSAIAVDIGVFGSTGYRSLAASFGGGIANSGTVAGSASSSGSSTAIGIDLRASTFSGEVTNSGTVSIAANGTEAFATGIAAGAVSFGGSIANSGTITVSATDIGGQAVAAGIAVYGSTSSVFVTPSGLLSSVASSFGGSIANSGTIAASGTGFLAGAAGIYADASTFSGSISNTGSITAVADGSFFTEAAGINLGAISVGGSVTNNGTINASANSTLGTAKALGIIVHGTSGDFSAASFFAGSVVNAGTIAVVATGKTAATATGISIAVSTFAGSVVNSGSISAAASGRFALADGLALFDGTYLGGITNSGTIAASATATIGPGAATATGVLLCGCVGPFSSGIANSGTIRATAQGRSSAKALGASLNSETLSGGLTNGGTISATANATNAALAIGIGIGFEGPLSLFSGGLTNSGTVSASAIASGSGFATATGIVVLASSLGGNITNSAGTIAAIAQATSAIAIGLHVETDTIFAGNIVNSGTISAAVTASGGTGTAYGMDVSGNGMSGTITNSGTVTASANQGTALGIRAVSFTGTIVNSGTIVGTVVGAGTGVGIGLATSSGTITNTGLIEGSTWGISLLHADGANTINENGGSIVGPTSGGGGAIVFSTNGDTLNINGGSIVGNIAGSGGVAPTVNIQPGAGNTFSYAGVMSGIGATNLKSGRLLLQNLTAAAVATTSYNQSTGATLALEVSPAATSNHASVAASGAISLASGAAFQAFEGAFAWTPGTYTYAAVVTGGAITGSFTTVTSNSPFFTASLSQSVTVDNLTLTMLSPSQVPGLDSGQQSVANAIIGIPGGNSTLDQIFELSNPGPALTQLSGSQYTQTNYQPLIQSWQMFTESLSDRLSQGGGYGGTVTASYDSSHGIQFAHADIPQVTQASDGARGAAPAAHWGLWARGYSLSSTAPSTATSASYSESGAGLIVGADNRISERIVAGVALNISTDKATVRDGGFTQTNAYQGSVYGQYQLDPNWYVNGIAGFGWQTYKTARVVTLLATSTDNGSFDGESYRLYGESGYALHPAFAPQMQVTPYLGLGYLHTHTDSFTESGATALRVQAMDPNSFTTTLGARAAATFQVGSTVFRPELRAAWQHEFLDASATVRASFAASPGSVFTATGTAFTRESFLGGAGVTTTITSSTQLFFDYDAKVNGGYTAQSVSGGFRVQF